MTNILPCQCEGSGFCKVFNRQMGERPYQICSGQVLTAEKQAAYKRNWLVLSGQFVHPDFCANRGEQIDERTCHVCGNRGKKVPVFSCSVYGTCTLDQWQVGQTEKHCKDCMRKEAPIRVNWDRKIEGLIPAINGQNFNCSLIEYNGRTLFAYRHNWDDSRIILCELNDKWKPIWNCRLEFPRHPLNSSQEDPRLFVYKGKLHIAFTAVQRNPELIAHVAYAELAEQASGWWVVNNYWLPKYKHRAKWEKNWGFFEADNQLWCVYDAGTQTILRVDGDQTELAYYHGSNPASPEYGSVRGGASPMRFGGSFYSFFHYRKEPYQYCGGLYTFDTQQPFTPIAAVPYPFLVPRREHCPSQHVNRDVVYPAGAMISGDEWVISYGAYDHDSRIAAFRVDDVDKGLRSSSHAVKSNIPSELLRLLDDIDKTYEGWCTKQKARWLTSYVLDHKPKLIVEIGVFEGKSLIPMAIAAKHNGTGSVIAIDAWSNEISVAEMPADSQHREWWSKANLEKFYQKFVGRVYSLGLNDIVNIIRSDSNAVEPPQNIDLLHVDGSHEATAESDIVRFSSNVRVGGLVVLDDLDWESGNPLNGAGWLLANGFIQVEKLGTGAAFRRVTNGVVTAAVQPQRVENRHESLSAL